MRVFIAPWLSIERMSSATSAYLKTTLTPRVKQPMSTQHGRKKPDKPPDTDTDVEVTVSKTVKTYLKSHLREAKDEVGDYLERTVQIVSQLAKRGSLLFNAALVKACASGMDFDLRIDDLQTLIYQAMMTDRIRVKKDFTAKIECAWEDNKVAYGKLLPSKDSIQAINGTFLRQVVTSFARKYKTNFISHLCVHFERRLGAYTKGYWAIRTPTFVWPKGGMSAALALFIQGTSKEAKAKEVLTEEVVRWVWEQRSKLTAKQDETLKSEWIEKNLPKTLKFLYEVLTFWDDVKSKHGDQIRRKPFTLAPLHQTRRLFIDIDSTGFYLLLKALNRAPERPPCVKTKDVLEKERNEAVEKYKATRLAEWEKGRSEWLEKHSNEKRDMPKQWQEPPKFQRIRLPETYLSEQEAWTDEEWFKRVKEREAWRAFFNVEEPATNTATTPWKFANHVSTDGVSLCILFNKSVWTTESQRDKILKHKEEASIYQSNLKDELEGKRVWYVDPGRTNIVTAYRFADGQTPTLLDKRTYSRGQYYEEAGITWANRERRSWNASWMDDERVQKFHKEHTFRTASYDAWKSAVQAYSDVHGQIWTETSKQRHSELSMKTYQGKQSALMRFWRSLARSAEERATTVVVYGVCYRSMVSGGKGEVSVPVKVAHKTCKECYPTFDLDEYRTSKTCALCGSDLQLMHCEREDLSKVTHKPKAKIHKEVRGLRCCRNPLCVKTRGTCLVDRDGNACWNFWQACSSVERPIHLQRTK